VGHEFTGSGMMPNTELVKAMKGAMVPTTAEQVKSFIGLITYYGMYIPHLSSLLKPLHDLKHKDAAWKWGKEE